ncbi:MAG: prephenate dehydrogenase/arogenate dehydrogenase family protein [Halanaeroarchaeum sp.]
MEVLIVGAGAVGRWVASVHDGPVAFADADTDAARTAAVDRSDARTVALDGEETFDVVSVAVPMRAATPVIEQQASRATRAIVDWTGSMRDPIETMTAVAPDLERVSYHPLFAPEYAPGRIAVTRAESGPATDAFEERFVAAGNELVPVSAGEHDEAMRTIQGRAHAAILAFGLAAEDVPDSLATPVFEDLDALRRRVTGGNSSVYADIQAVFDGAEDVADAARAIAEADRETFADLYDDAS